MHLQNLCEVFDWLALSSFSVVSVPPRYLHTEPDARDKYEAECHRLLFLKHEQGVKNNKGKKAIMKLKMFCFN